MPSYRVEIPYTEPSFSIRQGRSPDHLYPGVVTVDARDEAEAIEFGLWAFGSIQKRSGVGWPRLPQRAGIRVTNMSGLRAETEDV